MRKTLSTISILQPHAWAIMQGLKVAEFRSRPVSYRGPLLIHAGKSERGLDDLAAILAAHPEIAAPTLYFGCLLGVVDLTDCRLVKPGEFALMLANPRPFEPVVAKGSLGLPYQTPLDSLIGRFADLAWIQDL